MAESVSKSIWRGREREIVSLYALGFLIPRCDSKGPLRDPTQIGIDVAVPQIRATGRKALVCKDLVIWRESWGTCWDERGEGTRTPLAILEWKGRTTKKSEYDEEWLRKYSAQLEGFTGYSVSFNPKSENTTLRVSRARTGVLERDWLCFP